MPWNKEAYERGARDGIAVMERDGLEVARAEYDRMRGGEYEVGFCKGVRRVLIDTGKWVECADFLLHTDVQVALRQTIRTGLDNNRVKWVIDPEVHGVVGLFRESKCLMVMYLEDGDFEETLELLEWADEFEADLRG